jgi:hypothetical protein
LGVIDDVKASTSDKETIHNKIPVVRIQCAPSTPSPDSASLIATDSEQDTLTSSTDTDTLPQLESSHPHAYFTSGENSLKLSGVGVFSPAASRPPSPTITRRHLFEEKLTDVDEGITFRKRATTKGSQDHGEDR